MLGFRVFCRRINGLSKKRIAKRFPFPKDFATRKNATNPVAESKDKPNIGGRIA
jgi:hypothetical protein